MKATATILSCALTSVLVAAQTPSPRTDPIEDDYRRLLAELEPSKDAPPSTAVAIEKMRNFLDVHGRRGDHARVPVVRTRLATACLHACDVEEARRQFDLVIAQAPPDPPDLVARARYGRAQALEQAGNAVAAREELEQILADFAGLRYARFAKVALARLADDDRTGARVGQRAPALGLEPLLDTTRRPHRLRDYANTPVVLVFWSPDVAESRVRLTAVTAAWQRGGGDPRSVLALGVATTPAAMDKARATHGLAAVMLPCADEFAHASVLAYRVTRLPTVVLIGPDGTVVGRDLPPLEIEHVARRLH